MFAVPPSVDTKVNKEPAWDGPCGKAHAGFPVPGGREPKGSVQRLTRSVVPAPHCVNPEHLALNSRSGFLYRGCGETCGVTLWKALGHLYNGDDSFGDPTVHHDQRHLTPGHWSTLFSTSDPTL
jgi:hypothetical protein